VRPGSSEHAIDRRRIVDPSLGLDRVLLHYVINPARRLTTNIRRSACLSPRTTTGSC